MDGLLPSCITFHPEFANACLNRMVLNIAFHAYRHHYGICDVLLDENGYIVSFKYKHSAVTIMFNFM